MTKHYTLNFAVFKDDKIIPDGKFPSAMECCAFILMKGWVDTVERFGMVYSRGVEIRPIKE